MPTKHLALALQAHALDWHGFTGPYYWVPSLVGAGVLTAVTRGRLGLPANKACQAQIREAAQ
jgi:hypothetical protein